MSQLLTRRGPPPTQRASERVAQAVEHVTFNHGVVGSSPTALTMSILAYCFLKVISSFCQTGAQV